MIPFFSRKTHQCLENIHDIFHILSFSFSPGAVVHKRCSAQTLWKCLFPHIYCTVASPYDIIATLLTLCTVTALFSKLFAFLGSCIAFTRPLPSSTFQSTSSVSVFSVFCRLFILFHLCVSSLCNMSPCGWGEMLCGWSGLPCACAYVHCAKGNSLFGWSDPLCGWSSLPSGWDYLFSVRGLACIMAILFGVCLSHFNGI